MTGTNQGATATADSGNTYTNNGGVPLPSAGQAISIEGHGINVTTIQLSAQFPRFLDMWYLADGQTYNQITLRNFTVDQELHVRIKHQTVVGRTMPVGVIQLITEPFAHLCKQNTAVVRVTLPLLFKFQEWEIRR